GSQVGRELVAGNGSVKQWARDRLGDPLCSPNRPGRRRRRYVEKRCHVLTHQSRRDGDSSLNGPRSHRVRWWWQQICNLTHGRCDRSDVLGLGAVAPGEKKEVTFERLEPRKVIWIRWLPGESGKGKAAIAVSSPMLQHLVLEDGYGQVLTPSEDSLDRQSVAEGIGGNAEFLLVD